MTATEPDVYMNEFDPLFGVLVADATEDEARRAVEREYGGEMPIHYLGIRVEPINNEDGRPGRKRRFHVFTDEPQLTTDTAP